MKIKSQNYYLIDDELVFVESVTTKDSILYKRPFWNSTMYRRKDWDKSVLLPKHIVKKLLFEIL